MEGLIPESFRSNLPESLLICSDLFASLVWFVWDGVKAFHSESDANQTAGNVVFSVAAVSCVKAKQTITVIKWTFPSAVNEPIMCMLGCSHGTWVYFYSLLKRISTISKCNTYWFPFMDLIRDSCQNPCAKRTNPTNPCSKKELKEKYFHKKTALKYKTEHHQWESCLLWLKGETKAAGHAITR